MTTIPIGPSKALCRLLCDTSISSNSGLSPNLAIRTSVSRALFAISAWKNAGFKTGDGVAVAIYARRFLEGSTTALLFRVDPLRILALRELQRGGSYQLAKRNTLAVQWAGDVIPSEQAGVPFKDCDPNKLDRALFSNLCSLAIWRPAVERLQNYVSTVISPTDWQRELLNIEPKEFSRKMAGQLNGSFSFFSKGVHNEWVDRRRVGLREQDARTYSSSAIKNISFCAAALCCCPSDRHVHNSEKLIERLATIELEFGDLA